MKRNVTIKDVAEHAGCGVATVSRVLNGTGPAASATRQRVLKAAELLQFEFSEIGRSLQSQTTRTIGCVVPSLINPVFADAVQGLQDEVQQAGYQLLLTCSNYSADLEFTAIRTLLAKQVDGLVITVSDGETSEGLKLVRQRKVPCCLMFNGLSGGLPTSSIDNDGAARAVADAFAEAGHIQTSFLALRFNSSDRSRQRFEGFAAACKINGMAPPALLQIDEDGGDLSALLLDLLKANTGVSGIFASNDFLALAAIRTARSLGRHVPDELSVVGFDGIDVGTMIEPSLATIETKPKRIGNVAAGIVLSAIRGETGPTLQARHLSFKFRPGGSLAPQKAGKDDQGQGEAAAFPCPERPEEPSENHSGRTIK
ncbi:MAG: LacI family DNA-binding transcriptional regulator [Geminicoccales bacterium]